MDGKLKIVEERKMAKYEIEYVQSIKMVIEADNEEEANDIAEMMDGEDIAEHNQNDYAIWNIRRLS